MLNHVIYRRPIYEGILIDAGFDVTGFEWAVLTVSILCGVPRP